MILASWGGKQLEVSARIIEGISKLGYYAEAETEDKEKDGRMYKAFKAARARTLDMDIPLNAGLGVNVRGEIESWMELCAGGEKSRFSVGGAALGNEEYILTTVKADNVEIGPGGQWKAATMRLEFAETGAGGSSGGSSGGSGGSSGSKSSGSSKKASVKEKSASAAQKVAAGIAAGAAAGAAVSAAVKAQNSAAIKIAEELKKAAQKKSAAQKKLKVGGAVSYRVVK